MVTKDAVIINGVIESDPTSGESDVYKRPGNNDLGLVKLGKAQLLYYWNGVKAIIGDFINSNIAIGYSTITTWNPADKGTNVVLSNSNLTQTTSASFGQFVRSVASVSSGSWYWENILVTAGGVSLGMANSIESTVQAPGFTNNSIGYYQSGAIVKNNGILVTVAAYTTTDNIGIYYSVSNASITFYKNGVLQYTATSANVPTGALFAIAGCSSSGGASTTNFGATAFIYQASTPTANGLVPSTPNLPFSAQDNGSNAATAYLMLKNANQAWTLTTASATPTLIADPNYPGTYTVPLTSLTLVGTVATATMTANTNFQVGSTVTVSGATPTAYNGAQIITGVGASSSATIGPVAVTISRVGTTATVVSTTAHGFSNGQSIIIAGANQAAYNGKFVITWISVTSFSFTVVVITPTVPSAATGTLLFNAVIVVSFTNSVAGYNTFTCSYDNGYPYYNFFSNGDVVTLDVSVGAGTISNASYSGFTVTTTGVNYKIGGGTVVTGTSRLQIPISTITSSNGIATVTTSSPHRLSNGGYGSISGANELAYNSTFAIVKLLSTTSFTYLLAINEDPPTNATGSITALYSSVIGASFTFTVAGSPASPATGTITAVGGRNTVTGIVYINGYFCVMDVFGVIYSSSPDNPSTWPALSYTTAQAENGAGVCLARSQSYVVAFKEWSTEFFYDAGNKIGSPLSPVSNGFIKIGCASGASIAELEDELIWLSQTRQKGRGVYAMRGTTQQKISTSDVDIILNRDNLSEVFAYAIKISGHGLYILTLVNTNITLVYDMASQSWSLWSSLTLNTSQSISTITQTNGIATVTFAAAHNVADGDPVTITGATQSNYNGSFQTSYISPTVLTINVSSATVTPATGTILGAGYTESYFQFSKFANALGQYLVLHNTNGHLYEIKPELNQDAGIPINTFFRTIRLDGGDLSSKRMAQIDVVGDFMTDVIMVRQSDDDSVSFSLYRPVNLAEDEPMIRRLGSYRRRSLELKHNGNNPLRLTALDLT